MRRWKRIMALLLVCVFMGRVSSDLPAFAKTTQQEIKDAQKEKDKLEQQLDKTQDKIDGLKGERKTLKNELEDLNEQLTVVCERLEELERQIEDKKQEIAETQAALEEAIETEKWQYKCMVIRVRDMYERNDTSYLNALLSTGGFSDLLNLADRFEKIADYDQMKFTEFKENRILIEETEARLQQEKTELDELQVAAEEEQKKVNELIAQTEKTIAKYSNQIEEAQRKAEEYEAEIKRKEEDLEYLKKKLEEEMRLSALALQSTWRDISEVKFEDGDRKLLACLIACEAGAEPYVGKVAVGSVVINRVLSSRYPNTVSGVIYQRKQFSPAGSGRLQLALAGHRTVTDDCYRAADEAMSGITNVGQCLYFRTPIPGLIGLQIGGHIFY